MTNGSTAYDHINLPITSRIPELEVEATFIMYILGVTATSILVHLIMSQNLEYTRRFFDVFISTPAKVTAFLLLGRAPLRYFGYLNNFPLANVIGIGGFGGLGLSMIYLFQRHFLTTSTSNPFTVGKEYGHRRKEVVLDCALQEEMALQLVCEVYHTVAGVVMGFLAMRFFLLCAIDHKHLDLLMTAGLLGPAISFVLVVLLAVIGFGAIWCLYRCNRWLHNRTMLKDVSFLVWGYCKLYN